MRRRRSWGNCGLGSRQQSSLRSEDSRGGCPHILLIDILFCNHSAGYAVAGVAGGIGFVVVGFGVDDDSGAAVAEQRVRAFAESYVLVLHGCIGIAFCIVGIIESVLLAFRIEMRASGFKVRAIALWVLMKVDGVLARRKIVKVKLEADARTMGHNDDRAYIFALSVLEVNFSFGCAGKSENNQSDGRG
jgi:hypothetical protein